MDILTRSAFYNQDRISIYGDFHEPKHAEKRNIGRKVAHYREARGLTQKELAARLQTAGCDMTSEMIWKAENGRRCLSIFEIDKLAEVLYVDYNALFAQDEPPLDI